MQVHYNLLNGNAPDRSRALLTVAPASAGLEPLQTMLLPGPVELACAKGEAGKLCDRNEALFDLARKYGSTAAFTPAGLLILCRGTAANPAASPVSTCDRRISTPTTIHVAAGHMHLLGSSIRLELNPGTPRAKVLLDIPRWDFHWQNAYTLARSVQARAGRRRPRHLPPRRRQAASRRVRRPDEAALRPVGRGHDRRDVPRNPAGHARVAPAADPPRLADVPGAGRSGPRRLRREPRARARRARARDRARGRRHARGRRRRHLRLFRDALARARRFDPDVAYAHFLVPAGLAAALATRAPLVVTAHGQDVANIGSKPGVRRATRHVVQRAADVIAVSAWLRARLEDGSARRARQVRGDRLRRRPRALRSARRRGGTRRGWAGTRTARRFSASAASRSARTSSASPARSSGAARAR